VGFIKFIVAIFLITSITISIPDAPNKLVVLEVKDIDDPATDTIVDPNGPEGDDNGYLGHGEDSLPVKLVTFHMSCSDAYYGIAKISSIWLNNEGKANLWMRIYPDVKWNMTD